MTAKDVEALVAYAAPMRERLGLTPLSFEDARLIVEKLQGSETEPVKTATREFIRVSLDMPVELNEAINAAAKRTSLTKAQYMRMALEVLGIIAGRDGQLLLKGKDRDGTYTQEILIPGVLRGQ